MKKISITVFVLVLFFGCSSSNNEEPVNNEELFTWTLQGINNESTSIWKNIDSNTLEIENREKGFVVSIEYDNASDMSIGKVFNNNNSTIIIGFDYSETDVIDTLFNVGRVTISDINSNFIKGSFVGSDAVLINRNDNTTTPINLGTITGNFNINK